MSKAALWSGVVIALIGAGSTIAAAYIGAQKTAQSGQPAGFAQNVQVGFQVMVSAEQNNSVSQNVAQAVTEVVPAQSAAAKTEGALNNGVATSEPCDKARRSRDRGSIANLSGTKDVNFTIDASPCKRRIKISIWGEAISIADAGARTAEFIAKSGDKELCRASTSLSNKYGSNVEFNTGWSYCEIMLEPFESINIQAYVATVNKAEASAIELKLYSRSI